MECGEQIESLNNEVLILSNERVSLVQKYKDAERKVGHIEREYDAHRQRTQAKQIELEMVVSSISLQYIVYFRQIKIY